MHCACPHCGGNLQIEVRAVDLPSQPIERAEDWLAPSEIAYRIGVGEQHVRRLIGRGIKLGERGFERRGGRLFATMAAIEAMRV